MANDGFKHATIDIPGVRVHYVREGAGTPLILLHGWPEFWYVYRKNIKPLARDFDVIVPDLRGFGESSKPGGRPSIETYVDDFAALVDALGVKRFGVVTHDVGAWVMQWYARRAPERLTGLFFFNCPNPGVGTRFYAPDHVKEVWYQNFHQLPWAAAMVGSSREACRLYFKHFLSHWAHDPHTFDADVDAWVDNFLRPGNLQGGFDWYTAVNETRVRWAKEGPPKLDVITVPTRVMWGLSDKVLPAAWRDRLGDYFSDIRVGVFENAGHFPHYERPDEANDAILRFFRGRD
ncbi:MAG: alpha/beta hydrolase [Alphaproteobacteria bacterium]|nr:alpha/beta hydrolase [Alphaproteobacteria bacterium]